MAEPGAPGGAGSAGGGAGAGSPVIAVEGLNAGYGAMQVLWDVTLHVRPGEGVLVLGANGAGKTTLLKAVAGLVRSSSGAILLAGEHIEAKRADQRARMGIGTMTEQGIFPELSVEENLLLGGQMLPRRLAGESLAEIYELFPEAEQRRKTPAGSLSGGQRKLVAVAKALMSRPKALVLDEPSAGLSPLYVKEVVAQLHRVRATGPALLLAEQNVAFLELAERVYVLEGGRVRFEGSVGDLEADQAMRSAFFGLDAK